MNWARRMLWFAFGAVAAGVLMVIVTSHAVTSGPSLEDRVKKLEEKVDSIEQRHKYEDDERKAAKKDTRN